MWVGIDIRKNLKTSEFSRIISFFFIHHIIILLRSRFGYFIKLKNSTQIISSRVYPARKIPSRRRKTTLQREYFLIDERKNTIQKFNIEEAVSYLTGSNFRRIVMLLAYLFRLLRIKSRITINAHFMLNVC